MVKNLRKALEKNPDDDIKIIKEINKGKENIEQSNPSLGAHPVVLNFILKYIMPRLKKEDVKVSYVALIPDCLNAKTHKEESRKKEVKVKNVEDFIDEYFKENNEWGFLTWQDIEKEFEDDMDLVKRNFKYNMASQIYFKLPEIIIPEKNKKKDEGFVAEVKEKEGELVYEIKGLCSDEKLSKKGKLEPAKSRVQKLVSMGVDKIILPAELNGDFTAEKIKKEMDHIIKSHWFIEN